ncbi:hypothetical protein MNBD_GAMMA13-1176 [hydrothermal vent metagenome]|uniref:Uncharacterized protein n=1 Tax=hydrothermal vent metagenome TaxID=652676 RepID=A0A3B0YH72_9ZZZZ
MGIKIVVLDGGCPPAGVDFPSLEAVKSGVEAQDLCARVSAAINHYVRHYQASEEAY